MQKAKNKRIRRRYFAPELKVVEVMTKMYVCSDGISAGTDDPHYDGGGIFKREGSDARIENEGSFWEGEYNLKK